MSPNPAARISRAENRAFDALRPVEIITGFTRYAEGSVLISTGQTRVLCTASVLERVPPFLRDRGQGWITAEYGMLPRATNTRGAREAVKGRQSGRTQEIQRLIGRSLRTAFDLQALGERTVQLDCDVLQADGGTRCASVTGAWVACALAVRGLVAQGLLAHDPTRTQVAAVSAGLVHGQPLLDLDYEEDSGCDTDLNVAMTAAGEFVEVQGTGEGASFSRASLAALLDLAQQGITQLQAAQRHALEAA